MSIGSAPVLGGTNFLSMSIGEKRAKEVAFLCRRYKAQTALEMGWINAVVADDQLEDQVIRSENAARHACGLTAARTTCVRSLSWSRRP